MSIDYDRLRALAEYSTPGPWRTDEHPYMDGQSVYEAEGFEVAQHLSGFNAELVALAPDLARELLRLRDGVQYIRGTCDLAYFFSTLLDTPEHKAVGANLKEVRNLLDRLLEGDTE